MDFIESISGLIISAISLIVALIIGILQVKQGNRTEQFQRRQDERDEQRHNDEIYAEATRFIQKYNKYGHESEIYLLPLCIAAYQYNPTYPYRRRIYREFCSLPNDVQKSVLIRCNINIPCTRDINYFSSCLEKLQNDIKNYCPDDENLFYDNGKYLERALLNHGEKELPTIRCAIDIEEQKKLESPMMRGRKNTYYKDMDYKEHITNLLAYEHDKQPIKKLSQESTNLGIPLNDDEILICYLCCIIAEYVPYYLSENNSIYEQVGCPDDYSGTVYMEDIFLKSLNSIIIYSKYKF